LAPGTESIRPSPSVGAVSFVLSIPNDSGSPGRCHPGATPGSSRCAKAWRQFGDGNSVTANETPKLREFCSRPPNCGVALAPVVSSHGRRCSAGAAPNGLIPSVADRRIRPLALSCGAQESLLHRLRKTVDDSEIGANSAWRLRSAQFPVLQCATTESESAGKLRL
jgi:hypothetical protein